MGKQRQQIAMLEAEISSLKQQVSPAESTPSKEEPSYFQIQLKEVAFDEELSRLQAQITSEQRTATTENIEIIRMQKTARDQANEISVLQVRCNKCEMVSLVSRDPLTPRNPHRFQELRNYKSQHQSALSEIEQLKAKLHAEQTISSQLQMELRTSQSTHNGSVIKLTQEVDSLKRENDILKESNDRVLAK